MQLRMIGLGRMGGNIVRRQMRDKHRCVVYDRNPAPVKELTGEGATGAASLAAFVKALEVPRAIWVMLPAGAATEDAVTELAQPLYARFRSREEHTFAERLLSAMRFKFGGHVEPPAKPT